MSNKPFKVTHHTTYHLIHFIRHHRPNNFNPEAKSADHERKMRPRSVTPLPTSRLRFKTKNRHVGVGDCCPSPRSQFFYIFGTTGLKNKKLKQKQPTMQYVPHESEEPNGPRVGGEEGLGDGASLGLGIGGGGVIKRVRERALVTGQVVQGGAGAAARG